MTDLPIDLHSVPTRLGVSFALVGEDLHGRLRPAPAICERGTVPAAALVYLADVVAGVSNDTDPDAWAFTSDASLRVPLGPPPESVDATSTTLRGGRRSVTCEVPLLVGDRPWGACFIGFARVPRREGDPPKPVSSLSAVTAHRDVPPLDEPLRQAAGFESTDPGAGAVVAEVRDDLRNPAGAMQGAIVASLAETAAEDLADHHRALGVERHVVTEMEIRYLVQNRVSPIVTAAHFVGPASEGIVRVDLVDDGGRGRVTTAVLARVRPAPA